jgi:hypothetical protein
MTTRGWKAGWLGVLAAAGLALAALGMVAVRSPEDSRDRWTGFLAAGDRLAAGGAPPASGLSARSAYLLAFHEAQDAADVGRMLAAAERLDRIGESALAAHVRRVAGEVAAEVATQPARR